MRIRGKKLTALLLALCILLGLAACGSGDDAKKDDAEQLSGTVYVPTFMDLGLEMDYISGGCCAGGSAYIAGEASIETEATDPDSGEAYTNYQRKSCIYRIDLASGEAEELANYQPSYSFESYEDGWFNLDGISAGADGTIWLRERASLYEYDLPDGFNEETDSKWEYQTSTEVSLMRQLDSTGNEIQRIDTSTLQEQLGENTWVNSCTVDSGGDLFVYASGQDGERVVVLDKDMKTLFALDVDMYGELVTLSDGSVGLRRRVGEGTEVTFCVSSIDKAAKDWGTDYPITSSINGTIYSGAGDYLFYYNSGESLYGYKAETQEGERLLSWSAADINLDRLVFFSFLSDGRVAAMTQEWGGEAGPSVELAVLEEKDASVLADKTILTYATMGLGSDVRSSIIKFNKTNSKYRIEIKDYSEYSTEADYSAGLTKLSTEILAGNVPDIFDTSSLPLRQYGAKGLVEDLWPFIDKDPDIGRETLMERVFTAAEQDGKLYQVFDCFSINTVIGSRKVVGDELGWTLAELQAALATMPEGCAIFGEGDTKSGMLQSILSQNLDAFVDWDAGTCSFDSDAFKAALEFCNSFPLEYDWENVNWEEREEEPTRISSGKQMLHAMSISGFGDIQMYEAMFGGEEALQTINMQYDYSGSNGYTVTVVGDAPAGGVGMDTNVSNRLIPGRYITYKGYPMEDGSCGSSFTARGLAMSSTCKDKDGAWSFLRELLLPKEDRQFYDSYSWSFPSNKTDFDAMVAEAMEVEYITDGAGKQVLDPDGNPIQQSKGGWGWGDSLQIDIQATSQEEYDQFMELYNTIDSLYSYETSIYDIISDQVGSYFAGDKSLDETASQIQSRVNLYINENK